MQEPVWLEYLGYKKPKPELSLEAWLPKHVKFANENVPGWVDAVKQKYGKAGTKYACVGYVQTTFLSTHRHPTNLEVY